MNKDLLPFKFPPRNTGPVAITHVTVVPMDSNRSLPDHTVLFEQGKITALGPSAEFNIDSAQVIDGRDKFLMPGLSDMYGSYSDPADAIMYLANGVTFTRTSGGSPSQLALERAVERGEFPGPRLYTTTPAIDGVRPNGRTDLPSGVPMTSPDQAEEMVGRYAERGYHQIRVYALLPLENLNALGKAAAAAGLKIVGKCPDQVTFEQCIAAGMASIDQMHTIARGHLQQGYAHPERWDRFGVDVLNLTANHLDYDAIKRLGEQLAESQVWNTPTLVWHDRISREPSDNRADPNLRYMPQSAIAGWEAAFGRFSARSNSEIGVWRKAKQGQARTLPKIVGILHEQGAPMLTGTDSPGPFTIHGFAILEELEQFVEAGMTPYEALRCSTYEPARFLGQTDTWGTVAVGKRADLVLTGSNPLDAIANLREIEAVFSNGYIFMKVDLNRLLEQRAESVTKPPELPSADLGMARGTGQVVDNGYWTEILEGREAGKIAFRHTMLPGGEWLIEERYTGSPRRFVERLTTRLELTSDFSVRQGEYRIETPTGEETCQIDWSESEGYNVSFKDIDGHETSSVLTGKMLFPGDTLAMSVFPLMIAQQPQMSSAKTFSVLGVAGGRASVSQVTISKIQDTDETQWQIKITHPNESSEQTYRLDSSGRFLGMKATSSRGPREFVPRD